MSNEQQSPVSHSVRVALVRGPIVSTRRALNNEATPAIAFALLAAYAARLGHQVTWADAIAEGLNSVWPLEKYPGYQCRA